MIKKIFFSATSVFFAFFLFVFLGMVVYADGASEDSEELVIEDGKYYQDYTSSIYYDEGKTIDQYLRTGYAKNVEYKTLMANFVRESFMTINGDDDIVKIIPKELFYNECSELYIGDEYGFYICSQYYNDENTLTNDVTVFRTSTKLANFSTTGTVYNGLEQEIEIVFSKSYYTLTDLAFETITHTCMDYYYFTNLSTDWPTFLMPGQAKGCFYAINKSTDNTVVVPRVQSFFTSKDFEEQILTVGGTLAPVIGENFTDGSGFQYYDTNIIFNNITFNSVLIALDSLNAYDNEYNVTKDTNVCFTGVTYDLYCANMYFDDEAFGKIYMRIVADNSIGNIPYVGIAYSVIMGAYDLCTGAIDALKLDITNQENALVYEGGTNDQMRFRDELVRNIAIMTSENHSLSTDLCGNYAKANYLLDNVYNNEGKLNPFIALSLYDIQSVSVNGEELALTTHYDFKVLNTLDEGAVIEPTAIKDHESTTITVSKGQAKNMTFTPSHTGYYDFTLDENEVDLKIKGVEKTANGYYLTKGTKYNVVLPASLSRSGYMEIKPYLSYGIDIDNFYSNLNTSCYFYVPNYQSGYYVVDSSKVSNLRIYDANFVEIAPNVNGNFAVYYLNSGKYYLDVASNVTLNIHKMDEASFGNYLDLNQTFTFTGSIAQFKANGRLLTIPSNYVIYDENFNVYDSKVSNGKANYRLSLGATYYIVSTAAVNYESNLSHEVSSKATVTNMNSDVELQAGVIYGYLISESDDYGISFSGIKTTEDFIFADYGYSASVDGNVYHCNYYEENQYVYFMVTKNAKPIVTTDLVTYKLVDLNGKEVEKINDMYSLKRGGSYKVAISNSDSFNVYDITFDDNSDEVNNPKQVIVVPNDQPFGGTTLTIICNPIGRNDKVKIPTKVFINAKESGVSYSLSANYNEDLDKVIVNLNATGLKQNDVIYVTIRPINCTSPKEFTLAYPKKTGNTTSHPFDLIELKGTTNLKAFMENQSKFEIVKVEVKTNIDGLTSGEELSFKPTTIDSIKIDWFFGKTIVNNGKSFHHIYNEKQFINMFYILKNYPEYNKNNHVFVIENDITLSRFHTSSTLNNICFNASIKSGDDLSKKITNLYFDEYPLFNQIKGSIDRLYFANCIKTNNYKITQNGLICNTLESSGTLSNINILDTITLNVGSSRFGTIAGLNYGMLMYIDVHTSIKATISGNGQYFIGGIVGDNRCAVKTAYFYGNINITASTATGYVGGIAGQLVGASAYIDDGRIKGNALNTIKATGNSYIGGITGSMKYTDNPGQNGYSYPIVTSCILDSVGVEGHYAGGMVGQQYSGEIKGSSIWYSPQSQSYVKGDYYAGGVAGYGWKIRECSVEIEVSTSSSNTFSYAGGICGNLLKNGSLTKNKSVKNIVNNCSKGYAGGIVGYAEYASITNNEAQGTVSGNYYVGGIIAYSANSTITNNTRTNSTTNIYSSSSYTDAYVGGICGYANGGSVSLNNVNGGTITGEVKNGSKAFTGGFIGYAKGTKSESNRTNGYTLSISGNGSVGGGYGFTVNCRINSNQVRANVSFYQVSIVTTDGHKYKCNAGGLMGVAINTSMYSNTVGGYLSQKSVSDYAWIGSLAGFASGVAYSGNSVSGVSSNAIDVWSWGNHKVHYNASESVFGEKVA